MTQTIRIHWESPISRHKVEEMVKPERGLYQFYGHHPVYGENVLLYIGKASRNLKSRLLRHEFLSEGVPDILQPDSISIGVAYIADPNVNLKAIENLLIFMHSPAWNSKGIRYTDYAYRGLKIHNKGNYEKLQEVVNGRDLFR